MARGLCASCYQALLLRTNEGFRQRTRQKMREYQCRPDVAAAQRAYRRGWEAANRDRRRRSRRSRPAAWVKKKYNLTNEEYERLMAPGVCGICGKPPELTAGRWRRLHIDHDHVTGEVRGILCLHCNIMLRALDAGDDWIEKAREYLKRAKS